MQDNQRKAMFAKTAKKWDSLKVWTKSDLKRDLHLNSNVHLYQYRDKTNLDTLNQEKFNIGKPFNKLSMRDKKILSEVHF